MLDRIRWIVGKKKPVDWDISKLEPLYGNWFPAMARFTFRPGTCQEYTFDFGGFWEDDSFFFLRDQADSPIMLPIFAGNEITIDGDTYQIEFVERFTLKPCRLCSIWTGFIGFSYYGYEGTRYKFKQN